MLELLYLDLIYKTYDLSVRKRFRNWELYPFLKEVIFKGWQDITPELFALPTRTIVTSRMLGTKCMKPIQRKLGQKFSEQYPPATQAMETTTL